MKDMYGTPTPGAESLLLPRTFWWLHGRELPMNAEYSFLQFTKIGTNHLGQVSEDGVACSTFLAWSANRANGVVLPTEVFDEWTTLSALQTARDATRIECENGLDADGNRRGNPMNACEKAGNQIADCMAGTNNGKRDNFGEEWRDPANWNGGRFSQTISSDLVVGHGWGAVAGNTSRWSRQNNGARRRAAAVVDVRSGVRLLGEQRPRRPRRQRG